MKFPKDDYETARKIGVPLFALFIANTVAMFWELVLRLTADPVFYYTALAEVSFGLPLYFLVSRNPVPESEFGRKQD